MSVLSLSLYIKSVVIPITEQRRSVRNSKKTKNKKGAGNMRKAQDARHPARWAAKDIELSNSCLALFLMYIVHVLFPSHLHTYNTNQYLSRTRLPRNPLQPKLLSGSGAFRTWIVKKREEKRHMLPPSLLITICAPPFFWRGRGKEQE